LSDSVNGSIAGQENEWQIDTTNINTQITNLTSQANQMQTTLEAELRSADSRIAQLQSQQQLLSESIQSLNFTAFGYNNTNTNSFTPSSGGG
jgi:flagellar capping protein FliD